MPADGRPAPTRLQQVALIVLRTLIGWHFLYEGYYKLVLPAWSLDGRPLPGWTSAGFLQMASGPLAPAAQRLLEAGWTPWIDVAIAAALLLVGLLLMLGLFTRLGCSAGILLLALFYLLAMPLDGVPRPGAEGTYLLVDKNLIELAALGVLLTFRTGEIAGLDLLWRWRREAQLETDRASLTAPTSLMADRRQYQWPVASRQ